MERALAAAKEREDQNAIAAKEQEDQNAIAHRL